MKTINTYEKKNKYKNLLILIFLIFFILMITYISYFAYEKKYQPKKLSNFQYSHTRQSNETDTNQSDPSTSFTYSDSLAQCPQGQCAINKINGIKRCPENINNQLIYNTILEACTRLNTCDYKPLPYAVNLDGSSNSNLCQKAPDGSNISCRCTNKIKCKSNVMTKFKTIAGTINSENQNYTANTYFFGQEAIQNQGTIGLDNITIEDPANEFCQINPGFTNVISPGCNFQNSIQDKLACGEIATTVFSAAGNRTLVWNISKQKESYGLYPDAKKNSSDDVAIGQTYLILMYPVGKADPNFILPPNGFITITTNEGSTVTKTETVYYSSLTNTVTVEMTGKDGQFANFIVLEGIYHISGDGNKPSGSKGFANTWAYFWPFGDTINAVVDVSPPNSVLLVDIGLEYCVKESSQPNYKNMLECVQNDNNICTFGNFTYNFDKFPVLKNINISKQDETFSRNFCQLNPGKNIDISRDDFMKDPTYYTLSCGIGSGCDGKFWESIGNKEPTTSEINLQAVSRYFPEVDIDGINGIWNIQVNNYPYLQKTDTPKNINPGSGTPQLISTENINPGDFWSVEAINQILVGASPASEGSSFIEVQNLFGLENYANFGTISPSVAPTLNFLGVSVPVTGYTLREAKFISKNNQNFSYIYFKPNLKKDVSVFTPITVTPTSMTSFGKSGIVCKIDNRLQLAGIDGSKINTPLTGDQLTVTIYKQFAFSGANYGTMVANNNTEKWNRRIYTDPSGNSLTYENTAGDTVHALPPQNTYLLNLVNMQGLGNNNSAANEYSSALVPFKIPLSMYYPVWNPVLYRQECIRCKPLLITYPQININNELSNVVIQFSGKDFGRYERNGNNDEFCFVSTSEINFDLPDSTVITSQRIVLKEPNNDVMVGDYVLDSTLKLPLEIVATGSPGTSQSSLRILPRIFPGVNSVTQSKKFFSSLIQYKEGDPYVDANFSYGLESSSSSDFVYKNEVLKSNQKLKLTLTGTTWSIDQGVSGANNYFFGKKYSDSIEYATGMNGTGFPTVLKNGFFFVPTLKVVAISSDKKVIETSSTAPYMIEQVNEEPTLVQFCRIDNNLRLNLTRANGTPYVNDTTELSIDDITDSRITRISVSNSSKSFLSTNPPLINLNTEGQNFL